MPLFHLNEPRDLLFIMRTHTRFIFVMSYEKGRGECGLEKSEREKKGGGNFKRSNVKKISIMI